MASAIRAEVDRSLAPFGGGDVAFEYTHDHDGDACLRVTVTHVAPALRIGCPRFDALVKECNDMSYRIVKMAHDAGEERIVYVNNRFPA